MNLRRLRLACANCGHLMKLHCEIHMIPCCPGKCRSGDGPRTVEEAHNIADVAAMRIDK